MNRYGKAFAISGMAMLAYIGEVCGRPLYAQGTQVELQQTIISIASKASPDEEQAIGAVIAKFADDHGLTPDPNAPRSPLWAIERVYFARNNLSLLLSFSSEHTFVVLSKRSGDVDDHAELAVALQSTLGPLGFAPWNGSR